MRNVSTTTLALGVAAVGSRHGDFNDGDATVLGRAALSAKPASGNVTSNDGAAGDGIHRLLDGEIVIST